MIIYADVLIFLNLLVNYFILLVTVKFLRRKIKLLRIITGSLLGAIASLYIFLPRVGIIAEISFKIALCLGVSLTVFGIKSVKAYLKASGVFFLVTCVYAGVMIAVWKAFKPYGMVINNSVVYFNISPVGLVVFSVAAYVIFSIFMKIFSRNSASAADCEITAYYGENNTEFKAIVDTGNSICDIFGQSEIIIVDNSVLENLFNGDINIGNRYRAIPFNSVSGYGMLDGYRCDKAEIKCGEKSLVLKKPILAKSNTPIREEYSGIVNPQILD